LVRAALRAQSEGDARPLNCPKMEGDVGPASQDDIDAMFN
jgi:chemotaxis protein CheZ